MKKHTPSCIVPLLLLIVLAALTGCGKKSDGGSPSQENNLPTILSASSQNGTNNSRETDNTGNAENSETTKNAENIGTTENAVNTGTAENAENIGTTENAVNTETAENAENTGTIKDAGNAENIQFPYTFTDSTGRELTLPSAPKNVAVLFSSYAEIWNTAGGQLAITVGESVERGFAAEGVKFVDNTAGKTIDTELLLSYEPDFVIGSADIEAQAAVCGLLANAGIPAALFQVDTFDDYLAMLKICTDITGDHTAYTISGTDVKTRIDTVLSTVSGYLANHADKQKRILFIRAGSRYSATKAKRAPENFVCVMLNELGSYNIADNAALLLDGLSLEEILLNNPDYIFLTTMGSEEAAKDYIRGLFSENGWKDLSAVTEGNYTFLPKELFHFKPNARWADAYAYLAALLYPELKLYD